MPFSGLKSPLTLIVLLAALWTFVIANQRPSWLRQTWRRRLLTTAAEGSACGVAWACILVMSEGEMTAMVVVNGVISALVWTITAFYSRTRYLNILQRGSRREIDS